MADRVVLASWQTGVSGLQWLDELVKTGQAAYLGGDGYPVRYLIAANHLLPIISGNLPANESPPVVGEDYFLPKGWNSKVKLEQQHILNCPSDEQLVVEAWDQS